MESFVKTYCKTEGSADELKIEFCHGGKLVCNKEDSTYNKERCELTKVPNDIFSCKNKLLLWFGPCTDAIEDQISNSIQAFFISTTSSIGSSVANFGKDYFFKLPYEIIGHEKFAPIFSSIQSLSIGVVLAVFLFNYWTKLIRVFQDDTVVVFTSEVVNYIYAIIAIYIFPFILEMVMRICAYLVLVLTQSSSGQLLGEFFVGYASAGVIMATVSPAFMLYYIVIVIALVWLVVKNIKRYVWLLILYMISPIFGPLYFIDSTRGYFQSFFRSFLMASFSVVIEVIIIMIGFTLSNIATNEGNLMIGAFAIVTFLLSITSETLLREIMMNAGFHQMSSGGRYMKQMVSETRRLAVNVRRIATKGK